MIKTILFSILAIFSSMFVHADDVKKFKKVDVSVVARVKIIKSDTCSVNVISSDNENPVIYEVDNKGVLKFRYKNLRSLPEDQKKVFIRITTPKDVEIISNNSYLIANKNNEKQTN